VVDYIPQFFLMLFFIFFRKKRAIATTNSDDGDIDVLRYVCILVQLLSMRQSAFSPEYMTPKKVRTKETFTPSMSIKSVFVYFLFWFYFGTLN
jgi:hypothetical protein